VSGMTDLGGSRPVRILMMRQLLLYEGSGPAPITTTRPCPVPRLFLQDVLQSGERPSRSR
jgi:hypothetical protein